MLIFIGMEGLVGYARHISNVDSAREGDLRVPKPERPPRAPTPLGTELVLHLRCVTLLTFVCMLRSSVWNVVPRIFLTSRYSDRSVISIPSHPHTTSHNAGQGATASASVLHPIDYQPWSWGLAGQLCRRVETTWSAGIGVIFKNPAV